MDGEEVRHYYSKPSVVEHYRKAALRVGLWRSETILINKYFSETTHLLELGCGAGRIAIGLWKLGWRKLVAIDYSNEMIEAARKSARMLKYPIDLRVGDALDLEFEDASFGGAIFGFNGLMQIPKRANRLRAMSEIYRVLQPGSYFLFTSHDRSNPKNRKYWKQEAKRWQKGTQQPELDEFGDIYRMTRDGLMYIHSPEVKEVVEDLHASNFRCVGQKPRSSIAAEPTRVQAFSDECRFWLAQKP